MAKRHDCRNRQAKQVLRNAMLRLMEKQDFDRLTVNEICAKAAISRTTFYQHYQDKFDLLVNCIMVLVEPQASQLERDDLEGYFDQVLTVGLDNQKVLRRLVKYNGTRELQRKMDARLLQIFIHYYHSKEMQGAVYDIPIELLAELKCQGVNSAIQWWYRNDFCPSKEVMIRFLTAEMRRLHTRAPRDLGVEIRYTPEKAQEILA